MTGASVKKVDTGLTSILQRPVSHGQKKLLMRPPRIAPVQSTPASTDSPGIERNSSLPGESSIEYKDPVPLTATVDIAIEQGRESGRRSGHAEGVQAGYEEGLRSGLQKAEEMAAIAARETSQAQEEWQRKLRESFNSITSELSRRFTDIEDDMVALVYEAVGRIIGDADPEDLARAAVRKAVADLNARDILSVRVHPDDLVRVQAANLFGAVAAQFRLEADDRVLLGGCLIDSHTGTIDARLETQLLLLKELLLDTRRARRLQSVEHPETS